MQGNYLEHMTTLRYRLVRVMLICLCPIHDFTKYKTARNISDLFYWPEGICSDTFVVLLALGLVFVALVDEIRWFAGRLR